MYKFSDSTKPGQGHYLHKYQAKKSEGFAYKKKLLRKSSRFFLAVTGVLAPR
jgi:hypothetical protein